MSYVQGKIYLKVEVVRNIVGQPEFRLYVDTLKHRVLKLTLTPQDAALLLLGERISAEGWVFEE